MGDGGEGDDKEKGNGAGTGDDLQGSRAVGVIIWEQELGGDGGHDKITIRIPSSVIQKDCGDEGAAYDN